MRLKGQVVFSLLMIVVGCYAIFSAFQWSFKARFFPLVVAIPLVMLIAAHLFMEWFGEAEKAAGPAVDLELSNEVAPDVARRRAVAIFSWIAGFIVLVYVVSFPIAVPLFIFAYLALQSRIGWLQSVTLSAATWGFFYFLFQRLLHLPFESGAFQTWLGL